MAILDLIRLKCQKESMLCETMRQIHRVPLFSTLTERELYRLEPIFHDRRFAAGEVIFEQGEAGVGMYVVMSGRVRISNRLNGIDREIAQLVDGQFFGEMALLDGAPRIATAVALEPSRLIGFFRPEFMEILELHGRLGTKISLQLARIIGSRLREALNGLNAHAAV